MLQLLPISQSLHHVPPKRQCFQASAFPQLRDAPRSDRSGGALAAHPRTIRPWEAPKPPHAPCCNVSHLLQQAPRAGEQTPHVRVTIPTCHLSPEIAPRDAGMLKSVAGIFFFPPFFFSSPKVSKHVPVVIVLWAVQGQCPRGAGLEPGTIHTHIPRRWETDVSSKPLFAQLTVYFHRRTMSFDLSVRSLPDNKRCYICAQNKGFAKCRNSLRASPLRFWGEVFFLL